MSLEPKADRAERGLGRRGINTKPSWRAGTGSYGVFSAITGFGPWALENLQLRASGSILCLPERPFRSQDGRSRQMAEQRPRRGPLQWAKHGMKGLQRRGCGFRKAFFRGHKVTVHPLGEVSRPH